MKYLEILELEQLSSSLRNRIFPGGRTLTGRIEAYSTKRAGDDKKQGKLLEQRLLASGLGGGNTTNTSTTTGTTGAVGSSSGVNGGVGGGTVHMGSGKTTVRLLIDLIQTLNASMTDFDFSCLTAESFVLVTPSELLTTVNSHLAELTIDEPSFLSHMWKNINESISLSACEVYCLADSCPFIESEDEIIWSFFYLLYNKELKRILLFACEASLLTRRNSVFDIPNDDDDDDEDDDVDFEVDQRRSNGNQRYLYHIDGGAGSTDTSSSMYRISSSSSTSNSSLSRRGGIGDNGSRYTRDDMLDSSDILGSLERGYDITSDDYDEDDEDNDDDK